MCMAKETKQNGSRDGGKSINAWCYLFLLDDDDAAAATAAVAVYCFAIDSQRCIDTRSSFYFISFSLIFGCFPIFPLLSIFFPSSLFLTLFLSLYSILVASLKLMDLRESVCTVVCAVSRAFALQFQMKIVFADWRKPANE